MGGLVSATVVSVLEGTQTTALAEGQMVLSVNSASNAALVDALRSLIPAPSFPLRLIGRNAVG